MTEYHKAATYLNPAFKDSKLFTLESKLDAEILIEEIFDELKSKGQLTASELAADEPASKIPAAIWEVLFEEQNDSDGETTVAEELAKYSAFKTNPKLWEDKLVEFWEDKKSELPKLFSVANFFMTIPATNNSTERLFSECANTFTSKRSLLGVTRFEQLVIIKWNGDLCNDSELSHLGEKDEVGESDEEEEVETEEGDQQQLQNFETDDDDYFADF